MVLTKAKISDYLFEHLKIKKCDAKNIVDYFFKEVGNALEYGEKVKLSGFGNFNLKYKKERPGRNPKTGEIIKITSRRVVTFKPGKQLKHKIKILSFKNYSLK
ncbi:integration host factor subunit alpha [Buchnera aphidicola]|uniref:integration host factor subunit alpha n=1 Tax=Buchnera aphidicola TaxID=9 RepID=UPI003463B5FF